MKFKTTYAVNPAVFTTEIDDELGLLDPKKGYYYMLNGIGAEIWKRLASGYPYEELVYELVSQYDVTVSTCTTDVASFCDALVKEGLLEEVSLE